MRRNPMSKIPESADELFNTRVPEAIANHPHKFREIGAIYLFRVLGDGGGTWTVDFAADPPICSVGDRGDAQCTLEVPAADFKRMLSNPAHAMQLYFRGKLKVRG